MNDQALEEKLSELTDKLMTHSTPIHTETLGPEERIVHQLYQTIAPDQGVDAAFRQQLTHALIQEWEKNKSTPKPARRNTILFHLRSAYGLAAATFLVLVTVSLTLVVLGGDTNSDSLPGTTSASDNEGIVNAIPELVVVAMITVGLVLLAWWINQRRTHS